MSTNLLSNLTKEAPELNTSSEEFQRLEYSLKLNLRLVNGRITPLHIYQVDQSSVERFRDRTQLESMAMVTPANQGQFEVLTAPRGRLNISPSNPWKFTFGAITEKPEDLQEDTDYTFCVFRVGVGKSYCFTGDPDAAHINGIPPKEGYDSVYLERPNNGQLSQSQKKFSG